MSKNLKKILVTGASLLMFASVSAGISNVNASHVSLGGGMGPVERALSRRNDTRAYKGTFRQHGYTFNEIHGAPANYIVGIDGNYRVSNHQVMVALRGGNPFARHYRKHARKQYRRPVRKARNHARKARKATKKHTRKLSKKSTKRARKHFVAVKKHIAKKAHHTLRAKKTNKRAPKNASKAYKKGLALGSYANSSAGDDTGSNREAIALMSTPFNNSSAKGFMANATKQFRHGYPTLKFKKLNKQYDSKAKQSATNAMNAWKRIWQNRNNPKFLMGMKANLGAYGDNEAVYMDPSMRPYQNNSSFKAGYLAGSDFTDGSKANNPQNDKIYSNYVNDYNPALDQHYNY